MKPLLLALLLVPFCPSPTQFSAPEPPQFANSEWAQRQRPVRRAGEPCRWQPSGQPPPCVWVQTITHEGESQVTVAFPIALVEKYSPDKRGGKDGIGCEVRLYFADGSLWQSAVHPAGPGYAASWQVRARVAEARTLERVFIGGYGSDAGEEVWP